MPIRAAFRQRLGRNQDHHPRSVVKPGYRTFDVWARSVEISNRDGHLNGTPVETLRRFSQLARDPEVLRAFRDELRSLTHTIFTAC